MNELKFLEVMGKIDNELIREADINTAEKPKTMRLISKRSIYAFGSVAAVAAIAVGSVLFFNSYAPSNLVDNSVIQPDKNGNNLPDTEAVIPASSDEESKEQTNEENSEKSNSEKSADEKSRQDAKETSSESNNSTKPNGEEEHSANNVSEQPSTDVSNPEISSAPQDNSTPQSTESQPSKQTTDTPSVKGYYKPFSATIDPDVDSFSEDELHHIDIRTSVGFYHQLTLDEYTSNGISSTISTTDFGEFIGKIIEVNDYDYHGNAAESQEPTLAGAEVYYYAPKGDNKAFIIVKRNDQCSIFISDGINTNEGYKAGLSFFNVHSAEDIESIEYQKYVPDNNGEMIISEQNVITDNNKVSAIYDLMCQLKPEDYSNLPEYAATPQWYINAWENYRSDPNAPAREDYAIIITLKDGTVLQEISYQPYLGNGSVNGMQELTSEQNSALTNLLK